MPKSDTYVTKAGPGRPKGSKNKVHVLLREAVLSAASEAGQTIGAAKKDRLSPEAALERYLVRQARDHPSAFMGLISKLLPNVVAGDESNPIALIVTGVVRAGEAPLAIEDHDGPTVELASDDAALAQDEAALAQVAIMEAAADAVPTIDHPL